MIYAETSADCRSFGGVRVDLCVRYVPMADATAAGRIAAQNINFNLYVDINSAAIAHARACVVYPVYVYPSRPTTFALPLYTRELHRISPVPASAALSPVTIVSRALRAVSARLRR